MDDQSCEIEAMIIENHCGPLDFPQVINMTYILYMCSQCRKNIYRLVRSQRFKLPSANASDIY